MELKVSIEKLQQGDERELKELYLFYFPHFLSFALRYIPSEEMCRDVVQEVFIAYWENHQSFSSLVPLKVYFYHSIRNKCLNIIRDSKAKPIVSLEEAIEYDSKDFLEEGVVNEEIAILVQSEIARLSSQEQKIVRLSLLGKSNKEIAEQMAISINTVKTHKQRAYNSLRLHLKDIYSILALLA